MKPIWIIARNTYLEIIRDRILYGLIVFALLLVGVSLAMGQLSFSERVRISANFGLASIQISAVILAIFVGSTLVSKEIDKKTIMTLLARPIHRGQFLIGKALGLISVIVTSMTGLAIVLTLIFYSMGMVISTNFFFALHGILLEAMTLLAFAMFFSTFASPMSVVSFCIGIFLIGHWLNSLNFFLMRGEGTVFSVVGKFIVYTFPNLELFNWRAAVVYGDSLPFSEVATASGYMALWFSFLLTGSILIFRRKDFG